MGGAPEAIHIDQSAHLLHMSQHNKRVLINNSSLAKRFPVLRRTAAVVREVAAMAPELFCMVHASRAVRLSGSSGASPPTSAPAGACCGPFEMPFKPRQRNQCKSTRADK